MFLKNIISLLLLCSLLVIPQSISLADLKIDEALYTTQINFFSNLYGVDNRIVDKVIDCESDYNPLAKGDGGHSNGIAQIQKPTWDWMELQYFKEWGEHLDYQSSHDQIKLLAYQISKGNGINWTTYRALMNGGTYSFWSKQNNKYYTIVCKLDN